MRLAVLSSPDSWYVRDLERAAQTRHQIVTLRFSELSSNLEGTRFQAHASGLELAEFDCILVRTMPPGSLEQVVFRMDVLGQLEARGTRIINPPRAIEAAVDKYLALARLQKAGMSIPPTAVCQTVDEALYHFDALGGDVVLKPIFGGEGRGITRVNDAGLALRAVKMLVQLGAVIYMQPFIPHDGYDLRLLMIGEHVFSIRRRNKLDWRTNVSRGATAEAFEASDEQIELTRRAARTLNAPLAGVDLLPSRDGQLYVLEVNAVPGWKALAQTLQVDIARVLLKFIEDTVQR